MSKNITIFFLLIAIIVMGFFLFKKDAKTERIVATKTTYLDKPKYKVLTLPFLDTLKIIDTVTIIEDYFSEKEYEEILELPYNSTVTLDLILSENDIQTLGFQYDLNYPKNYKNTVGVNYNFDGVIGLYYSRNLKRINITASIYTNKNVTLGIGYNF